MDNDAMMDVLVSLNSETTNLGLNNNNFKIPKTTSRFSNWRDSSQNNFGSEEIEKETTINVNFNPNCSNYTKFEFEDEIAGVRCADYGDDPMTQDLDQNPENGYYALM